MHCLPTTTSNLTTGAYEKCISICVLGEGLQAALTCISLHVGWHLPPQVYVQHWKDAPWEVMMSIPGHLKQHLVKVYQGAFYQQQDWNNTSLMFFLEIKFKQFLTL